MHISQKSFLPSFLHDLPVGHDKPLHASLYQTESFQDNANYDKFHHPALCAFPLISLIRGSRGGSRCFSWGACCLIEWCWNCNPQPPLFLPLQLWPPRLFCLFAYFPLFEAASLGLVGNGSANLTWAQKNCVNTKMPRNNRLSVTVRGGEAKQAGACVCSSVRFCDMKDGTAVWNVCSACDSVKSKHTAVTCGDTELQVQKEESSASHSHKPFLLSPLNSRLPVFVQFAFQYARNRRWITDKQKKMKDRAKEMVQKAQRWEERSDAVPPSLNRWQYGCIKKAAAASTSSFKVHPKSWTSWPDALESG